MPQTTKFTVNLGTATHYRRLVRLSLRRQITMTEVIRQLIDEASGVDVSFGLRVLDKDRSES